VSVGYVGRIGAAIVVGGGVTGTATGLTDATATGSDMAAIAQGWPMAGTGQELLMLHTARMGEEHGRRS